MRWGYGRNEQYWYLSTSLNRSREPCTICRTETRQPGRHISMGTSWTNAREYLIVHTYRSWSALVGKARDISCCCIYSSIQGKWSSRWDSMLVNTTVHGNGTVPYLCNRGFQIQSLVSTSALWPPHSLFQRDWYIWHSTPSNSYFLGSRIP